LKFGGLWERQPEKLAVNQRPSDKRREGWQMNIEKRAAAGKGAGDKRKVGRKKSHWLGCIREKQSPKNSNKKKNSSMGAGHTRARRGVALGKPKKNTRKTEKGTDAKTCRNKGLWGRARVQTTKGRKQ